MIRTRKSAWVASALTAAVFAAALAAPTAAQQVGTPRQGIEAIVNDEPISTYDLRQRMNFIIGMSKMRPTQENVPQLQREALISIIDDKIRLQELKRLEKDRPGAGIVASDKDVDEAFESTARSQNMTSAQYSQLLNTWGVDVRSERERLRAERSWGYWIGGFYGRRVRVSPEEVDAALSRMAENQARASYDIAEIFIDSNRAGGIPQATQLANQLIAQMQQGVPFQSVAQQFSAKASAARGGEAGWLSSGQIDPEVERVIEQIRPGQLSRPIPVKDGVYLIYVKDKRSASSAPVVNLKQVATMVPANASAADVQAAQTKLLSLKGKITSCDTLESVAQGVDGVVAGPLGEAEVKDLAAPFRDAAERLAVNQVSDPIRTDVGLHLVAVCGRRNSAAKLPTRQEMKSDMENERLAMVAKREILKLRNAATIEQN